MSSGGDGRGKKRKSRRAEEIEEDPEPPAKRVSRDDEIGASAKKKKKRRQSEVEDSGRDAPDIGSPVCLLHDSAKKQKKKRKRSHANDEADGAEAVWTAALDALLLEGILPHLPKLVNKRGRDQKLERLDWPSLCVGGFDAGNCRQRLGQLEALVRPVKTQHQIASEVLELVKSKAPVYAKAMKPPDAPLGPRRCKSAYLFFCDVRRPSLPSQKPTEALQMLAKEWKALTDKEKTKYDKKALRDRERYDEELKVLKKEHPDMFESKGAPAKRKTVGPPPPAKSHGDLFKADFIRKFTGSGDGRELAKTLWKEMSAVGRVDWKEQWEKNVKDYRREMEKLLKTADIDERQLIEKLLEKHSTGKDPSKVGFDLFAKTKRAELRAFHPTWTAKEINDLLIEEWKKLGNTEQRRYVDQAKILQTQQDAAQH